MLSYFVSLFLAITYEVGMSFSNYKRGNRRVNLERLNDFAQGHTIKTWKGWSFEPTCLPPALPHPSSCQVVLALPAYSPFSSSRVWVPWWRESCQAYLNILRAGDRGCQWTSAGIELKSLPPLLSQADPWGHPMEVLSWAPFWPDLLCLNHAGSRVTDSMFDY